MGGILAGQSLIRAAELRAVTAEYQRYSTAVNSFRDKYFALPGDMNNAESFWGTYDATDGTCQDGVSTNTLTCNGDGDNIIEVTNLARSREVYRFWQHLANAGLMEGQYSGTFVTPDPWGVTLGTNAPRSRVSSAGWGVIARTEITVHGGWYANMFQPSNSTHWFEFGVVPNSVGYLGGGVLKNEDAWNIDTKTDDGKPGAGKITTFNNTGASSCASSDTASSATYQLSVTTSNVCTMFMGF